MFSPNVVGTANATAAGWADKACEFVGSEKGAMKKSVLVIGHGPIGHSFIEKMTSGAGDYEVSVLCEEPRPAYNRVMLTQYFEDRDAAKHDKMKLSYVSEDDLKDLNVKLIYGRAMSIDREAKKVSYAKPDGQSEAVVDYNVLVLATGSFCFVPPVPGMTIPEKKNMNWPDDPASRPDGVFVYRTIEDLESLIARANAGAKRAVVIGGGLLGLEAAKAVYDLKMESHVLEMAPYLMPTQLNEAAGKPVHAKLLATDLSEDLVLKYTDRFLMFYITTAKHLQRTAPWLAELEGGIEYLKKVVIEDSLGIACDLEKMMERNRSNEKCEWKAVAYDEGLRRKFKQFANTDATHDSEQIEYISMRGQRHPNLYSPPDITGPALYSKDSSADDSWEWIFAGIVSDYPKNGGLSVKHGTQELAVFHLPGQAEEWFATQNLCPHKQARSISRGLVGVQPNGTLTVADPIYKTTYNLRTGEGIANPSLNLSTFNTKVEDGKVFVQVPSSSKMEEAFEKIINDSFKANGKEKNKTGNGQDLSW
eukprot:Skav201776  [mRNA]  locus=scaffold2375:43378:48459:- [translate_table: standard]